MGKKETGRERARGTKRVNERTCNANICECATCFCALEKDRGAVIVCMYVFIFVSVLCVPCIDRNRQERKKN